MTFVTGCRKVQAYQRPILEWIQTGINMLDITGKCILDCDGETMFVTECQKMPEVIGSKRRKKIL